MKIVLVNPCKIIIKSLTDLSLSVYYIDDIRTIIKLS